MNLERSFTLLMAATIASTSTNALAQEASSDPRPAWDQAVEASLRLESEAARIEYLFDFACRNGRDAQVRMDLATSRLGDSVTNAFSLPSHTEDTARMFGGLLGSRAAEMRNAAVEVGFWTGLCHDYTRQVEELSG